MACRVLLTTTVAWASVARLARGFEAASCRVDAHAPSHAPVFASRYVAGRYDYRPLFPLESLKSAINEAWPDLIVPCDDRAVAHLLTLYAKKKDCEPHILKLIERSLGEPASYPEMMSRSGFMTRAQSLGIRAPATRIVSDAASLDAFIAEAGLPVVLKADGSWGGEGVVVARSREEAHRALARLGLPASRVRSLARAMRRRDAHYLKAAILPSAVIVGAQKFVTGRPAASAFACRNGEILGSIYYDVLVADGEIGPPNVIRRVSCPAMEDATRKIARHYRLSGIHGMDFLRDETGAAHLIEINPRATQGGALAFGPGHDLPAALVADRQSKPTMRAAIPNDTVAIFPREWQRDPASPWLQSAFHDVPWDDPGVLLASLRAARLPAAAFAHATAGRLPCPTPGSERASVAIRDTQLTVPQRLGA